EPTGESRKSGKHRGKCAEDATPGKDTKGDGPDGTSEAARRGRSFDVKGTPRETWDAVCDTLLRELRAEGHENLRANAKKKTTDKSRYKHYEILCKHSGEPRRGRSKAEDG
ncbi:unnamed protein product, partial [Hapterophycus canaliculatus]